MEVSKHYIQFKGINIDDTTDEEIQHAESDLFILNDEMYKVLSGDIAHRREKICSYLKECNSAYFKINELCFENEKFFAYSMPYYKEFKSLKKIINTNMPLEERKKICIKLLEIYENILFEHKLTFYDWHMDNVLIKKEEVKLIDIDSSLLNSSYMNECNARKYLLMLIIEFLNDIDDTIFIRYFHEEIDILEKLVTNIDVSMINTLPLAFEDIRNEITSTSEAKIEENKILTKKLLKFDIE